MRNSVIDKIKGLALTGYATTEELPFDDGGVALYLKNPKTLYIDRERTTTEPLVLTLGADDISRTTTSITAYFTVDAKNPPANYQSTVDSLRSIRPTIVQDGANSRDAVVSTSYTGDLLVTEVEYSLTRVN